MDFIDKSNMEIENSFGESYGVHSCLSVALDTSPKKILETTLPQLSP